MIAIGWPHPDLGIARCTNAMPSPWRLPQRVSRKQVLGLRTVDSQMAMDQYLYIYTIFRGMNIHKSQRFWCERKGYKVLTHCQIIPGIWEDLSWFIDITYSQFTIPVIPWVNHCLRGDHQKVGKVQPVPGVVDKAPCVDLMAVFRQRCVLSCHTRSQTWMVLIMWYLLIVFWSLKNVWTFSGWWFGTFLIHVIFFRILGYSSSQLTFIFFRGVGQPPTRTCLKKSQWITWGFGGDPGGLPRVRVCRQSAKRPQRFVAQETRSNGCLKMGKNRTTIWMVKKKDTLW